MRRTIRHLSVALVLIAAGIAIAKAETYPSRPITIVVPYPAGGPTDTLARILTDRMSGSLGQPLIIENVAGAGGSERAVRPARRVSLLAWELANETAGLRMRARGLLRPTITSECTVTYRASCIARYAGLQTGSAVIDAYFDRRTICVRT